jgi:hypothetical protein
MERSPLETTASHWELLNGNTLHFFNLGKSLSKQTELVLGPNTYWTTFERKED